VETQLDPAQNPPPDPEILREAGAQGEMADIPEGISDLKISVNAALRDRGDEARPVTMLELQQLLDKKVWQAVRTFDLTALEHRILIRSSMFLKDKYMASGIYVRQVQINVSEKGVIIKTRSSMTNVSFPSASPTSVLAIASIDARVKICHRDGDQRSVSQCRHHKHR
jgi:hypothetical protein